MRLAQQPLEQVRGLADGVGRAHMTEMRRAFVEIVGLGLPAEDPADAGNAASAGAVAVGLVALLSLTKRTPSLSRTALHAVREAGVGAEAFFDDDSSSTPSCLANAIAAAAAFCSVVRTLQRRP